MGQCGARSIRESQSGDGRPVHELDGGRSRTIGGSHKNHRVRPVFDYELSLTGTLRCRRGSIRISAVPRFG